MVRHLLVPAPTPTEFGLVELLGRHRGARVADAGRSDSGAAVSDLRGASRERLDGILPERADVAIVKAEAMLRVGWGGTIGRDVESGSAASDPACRKSVRLTTTWILEPGSEWPISVVGSIRGGATSRLAVLDGPADDVGGGSDPPLDRSAGDRIGGSKRIRQAAGRLYSCWGSGMGRQSTVVFWGAGATARLGMRMTAQQGEFIVALSGVTRATPADLPGRVEEAFGPHTDPHLRQAMVDLLTILADGVAPDRLHLVETRQLAAMRSNWEAGADDDALRARVLALRLVYDWPALQDVLRICPGIAGGGIRINDLFNILDMHAPVGHGFRDGGGAFLDARRLMGAKAALRMILHAMFYVD